MADKFVKKYNDSQKKSKILELLSEGYNTQQIAQQVGVARNFVNDTIRAELASATTPEKILELRQAQSDNLNSHLPRLNKRFLNQTNIADRLIKKYEQILDADDNGTYNFSTLVEQYTQDGEEPETAYRLAKRDIEEYNTNRARITTELEKTSKIADQHFMTLLKLNERLSKLNGLDSPPTQSIMIHRTDDINIQLQQDILNTHKQLKESEKPEPTIEAEIIDG